MTKAPDRIPDDTWRYMFPQETAYNLGKARQIEDIYHPGERRDFIEKNPSLVIGGGALAGGLAGYALKDYLLRSHPGMDDSTAERTLLSLGLAGAGAAGGAALTNYLLVKPKIDAANELVDSLHKKSMDWEDAWGTTKDVLKGTGTGIMYGAGTAAVLAGGAYLYDKDMFKEWARKRIEKLESRLKKQKLTNDYKDNIVNSGVSLSLGGPGVVGQVKNVPLVGVAHTTGAGFSVPFTNKNVGSVLRHTPFVSDRYAKQVEHYLPPKMFAGLEASVLVNPITMGVILDKGNLPQTLNSISRIKKLLTDKNFEKKVDKRVYGELGHRARQIGSKFGLTKEK
jgi:hypothetical protein